MTKRKTSYLFTTVCVVIFTVVQTLLFRTLTVGHCMDCR